MEMEEEKRECEREVKGRTRRLSGEALSGADHGMERYRHFSLMLATLVHSCPGARTTGGRGTAKVPEYCSATAFRETLQVLGEWEALSRHESDIQSTLTIRHWSPYQ